MSHVPNIEKALKIEIEKYGNKFRADAKALPGSPLCGEGETEDTAKSDLYMNWLYIIASYYGRPENQRTSGNMEYVPIILDLLKKDLDKI